MGGVFSAGHHANVARQDQHEAAVRRAMRRRVGPRPDSDCLTTSYLLSARPIRARPEDFQAGLQEAQESLAAGDPRRCMDQLRRWYNTAADLDDVEFFAHYSIAVDTYLDKLDHDDVLGELSLCPRQQTGRQRLPDWCHPEVSAERLKYALTLFDTTGRFLALVQEPRPRADLLRRNDDAVVGAWSQRVLAAHRRARGYVGEFLRRLATQGVCLGEEVPTAPTSAVDGGLRDAAAPATAAMRERTVPLQQAWEGAVRREEMRYAGLMRQLQAEILQRDYFR